VGVHGLGTLGKIIRSVRAFRRELAGAGARPAEQRNQPKIGLALGGGFARGLAHIGVLKVFEEENIPVSFIAGTSVGALLGATYCSGVSAKEMEELAGLVRFKHFAKWTISRYGFASNERMIGFLTKILKCKTFEELRIPLAVTATDFVTGEGVVFDSGPLIDPVRASCAYPGMFLPVDIKGRLLVDGLLSYSVPTVPARNMGADKVLAVHLRAHWVNGNGPRHIFDVIGQCFSIAQAKMCELWQPAADLIIEPNVNGFTYDGFERARDLVRSGEEATRAAMPEIRKWLATEPVVATATAAPRSRNAGPQAVELAGD
jgi:NTE family protein